MILVYLNKIYKNFVLKFELNLTVKMFKVNLLTTLLEIKNRVQLQYL